LSANATDSTVEIQAVVDAATKLFGLADQITTSGSALASVSLNAADLTALGVQDLGANANKLALLNSLLDTLPFTDVDTVGELANLVDIVNRLIKAAMGELVVPALTPADFAALGITGVTDSPDGGNLSVVVAALGGAGTDGSGINSIAKLTNVVNSAVTEFTNNPTIKAIIDYANSNLNPLPTVIDYNAAGINLVDAETLEAVNKIVDSKIGSDVSSSAKVYQIVYDLFVALGKIVAYVADTSANTAPTQQDYQAAGLVDLDPATAARLTAAIAGLTAGDVDSAAKLAAILRELRRPIAPPTPTPGPEIVGPPVVVPVDPVDPVDPGPITPPAPEPVTKVEVKPIVGGGTGLNLTWAGASAVAVKVVGSTGIAQEFTATGGEIDIKGLTPGRAYAIQLVPVGSSDPNQVQTVNYVVTAASPINAQITPLSPNRVQISWAQDGFAKLYKVTLTPTVGAPIVYTTGDRKIDIGVLAGAKYGVNVVAVGEGDTNSPATLIDLRLNTAVASVVATPFAAKKETLISWKSTVISSTTKYLVRVDGKIVCTGTATTCIVKKVLTSKNLITVAVDGGAKTAVAIDDKKLVFESRVTFAPNSVTLSAAAVVALKQTATDLKKAKFTKIVVTGHANPVDGVPIAVSEKIANQRALAIVKVLQKLLPGVKIVAVGRSVFAPAGSKADQSLSNMRAEIYGSK
jgi:outer membrane protein OmpA-like peptidoglycan-associated protein